MSNTKKTKESSKESETSIRKIRSVFSNQNKTEENTL